MICETWKKVCEKITNWRDQRADVSQEKLINRIKNEKNSNKQLDMLEGSILLEAVIKLAKRNKSSLCDKPKRYICKAQNSRLSLWEKDYSSLWGLSSHGHIQIILTEQDRKKYITVKQNGESVLSLHTANAWYSLIKGKSSIKQGPWMDIIMHEYNELKAHAKNTRPTKTRRGQRMLKKSLN